MIGYENAYRYLVLHINEFMDYILCVKLLNLQVEHSMIVSFIRKIYFMWGNDLCDVYSKTLQVFS